MEETKLGNPKTFWGGVTFVASVYPILLVGLPIAGYKAIANKRSFKKEVNDTLNSWGQACIDFGDEHSKVFTDGAIKAGLSVVGTIVGAEFVDHLVNSVNVRHFLR